MLPRTSAIIVSLLLVMGVGSLLYPQAAHWQSSILHSHEIHTWSEESDTRLSEQERHLVEARTYNSTLTAGGSVAAGERVPSSNADYHGGTYDALFDGTDTVFARIQVPQIGIDLPIYKTVADTVLMQGVGHLPGTSMPVGGDGTHAVLSAHRGLAASQLFTDLDHIELGDTFTVAVAGEVLSYEVTEINIVKPDETEFIRPQAGKDLITLVTCTPLGINTDRILVTGERTTPTPTADIERMAQDPTVPFPWWGLGIVAAVAVAIALIATSHRTEKKHTPTGKVTVSA